MKHPSDLLEPAARTDLFVNGGESPVSQNQIVIFEHFTPVKEDGVEVFHRFFFQCGNLDRTCRTSIRSNKIGRFISKAASTSDSKWPFYGTIRNHVKRVFCFGALAAQEHSRTSACAKRCGTAGSNRIVHFFFFFFFFFYTRNQNLHHIG